ncbi:uncharacterized protein LOC128238077 [Mya arenaria]|uniref:uncharacterized protein LOC128238077 n=1 Tax=Mya arenaria TaxID=6604 RepID=UPI0022E4E29C|nr:uncharacterized protein LOC128238077 [Mya arenaria]
MHDVGVIEVNDNRTERPGGSSACIDKYCDETSGPGEYRALDKNMVEMGVPDEQSALNQHEQGGHTLDQVDDQQADDTDIVICQLYYKSLLHVDMKVQDAGITAVVDTAAEVSLISFELFESLDPKPKTIMRVKMYTAGKGLIMNGLIVGPVKLKLGSLVIEENIYVSPIRDQMLLGLDNMLKYNIAVDIPQKMLRFSNECVPMLTNAGMSKSDVTVSKYLGDQQQQQMKCLLIEFEDVFALDEFDLGNFTAVQHEIETEMARPVKSKIRRTPMGFAAEEEEHLNKMLKTKPKVGFLGRWVGPGGMEVSDADIKVVKQWKRPVSTREVEQFLGLVNYHRTFIPNLAKVAVPLYAITGKREYTWQAKQDEAFQQLMTSPPVLALPNSKDPFVLDTDASDRAVGAALSQIQDGKERVFSFAYLACGQNREITVQHEKSYWLSLDSYAIIDIIYLVVHS